MTDALTWKSLSSNQIRHKQGELLLSLLKHSFSNVPYYKKIIAPEITSSNPKDIYSLIKTIPLLTKNIIRDNSEDLLAKNICNKDVTINMSGGSTGEPVEFYQDKYYKSWNIYANKLVFNEMLGKEMGEREINLWGSERDIYKGSISLQEKIQNFLYNRIFLNSFRLSEQLMEEYAAIINRYKPKSIWTYVESIYTLSNYIKEKGIEIYSPDIIISTAGTLYPEIRLSVEEVFGCKVYNQYGSREVGPVACQCKEQSQLHIFPWSHYIEILDSKGETVDIGQEGNIVITCLTNFSMPLIRYSIGDKAIRGTGTCKCGRNTADIAQVQGRNIEQLLSLSGELIHGQYFIKQLVHKPWIKKFQIIQEAEDRVLNKIVTSKTPPKNDLNEIVEREKLLLGEEMNVTFEFVDEIESSDSGKYMYIISKISHDL
jgi:phenylacetate-CoA ligase